MKVLVYSEETPPPLFKLGESKISLLLNCIHYNQLFYLYICSGNSTYTQDFFNSILMT